MCEQSAIGFTSARSVIAVLFDQDWILNLKAIAGSMNQSYILSKTLINKARSDQIQVLTHYDIY